MNPFEKCTAKVVTNVQCKITYDNPSDREDAILLLNQLSHVADIDFKSSMHEGTLTVNLYLITSIARIIDLFQADDTQAI